MEESYNFSNDGFDFGVIWVLVHIEEKCFSILYGFEVCDV